MQRRFDGMRRRQPVAQWGFLRPHKRQVEDEDRLREHLRENPGLQKEYRSSLMLQLGIIGALTVSCIVLLFQSIRVLNVLSTPSAYGALSWALPMLVGFLGLAALRRFLNVLVEYRRSRKL